MDIAQQPLACGPLIVLRDERLSVSVAAMAGGRLAQVSYDERPWLVTADDGAAPAIAWGCYPMLPWAGRLRQGRFDFEGRTLQLPPTLGAHAIHGIGYLQPWQVDEVSEQACVLSLALGEGPQWPFGGHARQRITLHGSRLRLELSLRADAVPMPKPVLGWHPWLRKPDHLQFTPSAWYPRDAEGMPMLPTKAPQAGPWDDCFLNTRPVVARRGGQSVTLSSDCDHWVVYDAPAHATCVEPQDGPPDAFNLMPDVLAPGAEVSTWFEWVFAEGETGN